MEHAGGVVAVVEAVVWTGGEETPYRRAGHGTPVLLLGAGAEDGDATLLLALAREFRVIAPGRLPPGGAGDEAWGGWLRGLIDGLGLDRPLLVADDHLAPTLDRCARTDPGRIRAVLPVRAEAGGLLTALRIAARDD